MKSEIIRNVSEHIINNVESGYNYYRLNRTAQLFEIFKIPPHHPSQGWERIASYIALYENEFSIFGITADKESVGGTLGFCYNGRKVY